MTTPSGSTPHSRGHLVASTGALLGWIVLGGPGGAIGVGLMQLMYEPEAGLANLALLIFPLAFGGLGVLAGTFLGIRLALRRYGHPHADETARLAAVFALVSLMLLPYAWLGAVLLPGVPAAARHLTLRRHAMA